MIRFRACLIVGLFGFGIIFALNVFKMFPNSPLQDSIDGEDSVKVHLVFIENVLENWLKDVQNYLVEEIDWDNSTFTEHLSQCFAICSDSTSGNIIIADNECSTVPLLISDQQVFERNLDIPFAQATLPCFLILTKSSIPNANRGVFTTIPIAKGLLFGPYKGTIRSAYGSQGALARDGGYAWRVGNVTENGEEADFYIDGADENNSNWLRYINSARFEEEQNLYPLEFNSSIFYIVYKNVEAGSELLVWYGKTYANWMGIDVVQNSEIVHDWEMDFAPKKHLVVCPTCEFESNGIKDSEKLEERDVLLREKDL